jgi:hypothetical protein
MRITALLLMAAALLALPAAAERPPDPTPAQTHDEFQRLCRQLRQGDDSYFGQRIVSQLEERLSQPMISPEVRVGVRARLAQERLRVGETAGAVDLLRDALAIAEREGLPAAMHLQLLRDLGLAELNLAEDENCVFRHTHGSCILPIAPAAVHPLPDATRSAGDRFAAYLAEQPTSLQMRWLLNLARMVSGDYPDGVPEALRLPAGALAPEAPFPHFTDVAHHLGVNPLDLSGGAIVDDFDGDGLLDIVTSTWDPCGPMKAFRNRGDGSFEDVSRPWGLASQFGGLNMMPADFDNDGRLDILVLRGAWRGRFGEVRNSLLSNQLGDGADRFVDVTVSAGLAEVAAPTQAAGWADYDGDGDLDLYVGHEAVPERPYPSQLFRNDGRGADGRPTFTDVTEEAGVANRRFAKAVAWGDYDDDGDPDLFVSNFGDNRLYRNDGADAEGRVTFTDVAREAGVTDPQRSFPSWFFDYDNDGRLDLFVADYGARVEAVSASYLGIPSDTGHPVLYRNLGGGRFSDVSAEVGLTRPLLPMGSNYGDLDNDGWLDVYLGTGVPDLEALMPNVALRNDGGRRFVDVTFAAGLGHLQKGHGIAFADLDNDGDQDVYEQMGGAYPVDAFFNALYVNPGSGNHWLTLCLHGTKANRAGTGARIAVELSRADGSRRTLHLRVGSGGSFGASPRRQEIGLGDAAAVEKVTVRWPGSGTVQVFEQVAMDRFYRVTEGQEELEELSLPRLALTRGER